MLRKALNIAKYEGFGGLLDKVNKKIRGAREFSKALSQAESTQIFLVSIVIPAYNASKYTLECLESIYSVKNSIKFEVILIDNFSSDNTEALMTEEIKIRENLSFIRLEENRGFAGGVNAGLVLAKGKYVVILNNDTHVTDFWLDRLVLLAEKRPELGIISPVTNFVGEGPQLDNETVHLNISKINDYASTIQSRDFVYEPRRLVFFCVLLRKSLIDQIGLLDEKYGIGNYEDDDYCLRALLSGYQLAVARSSFVYHHGSITFQKNRISHSIHMEENFNHFYGKVRNLSTNIRFPNIINLQAPISLVVRTVNRPALFTRALTSLSNQTCKNFEVIVVNDGGEDVDSIIRSFDKHFPIRYIYNREPHGRAEAINDGLRETLTKWVGFLDDDDILYPWHVAVFTKAIDINPEESFFYSNYNRTFFNGISDEAPFLTKPVEPWKFNKKELLVNNRMPIHTWLLRKAFFSQTAMFDPTIEMLEDYEVLIRLSGLTDFCHINEVTCEYRFYLDGQNSMLFQREKVYQALKDIYGKNKTDDGEISKMRDVELSIIRKEVEKISGLRELMNENPERKEEIYSKILATVFGFE